MDGFLREPPIGKQTMSAMQTEDKAERAAREKKRKVQEKKPDRR